MLLPDFSLEPAEMVALSYAFESVCKDLGIGNSSLDVSRRERIFQKMLSLVQKGEIDGEVIRRRAVLHFANTSELSA